MFADQSQFLIGVSGTEVIMECQAKLSTIIVQGCLQNKKRKKFQTIVKKVGGGDTQIQNKNWKLIFDKSKGREGAKSVCQNMIKVQFCLGFYEISGSKILKGFVMCLLDVCIFTR